MIAKTTSHVRQKDRMTTNGSKFRQTRPARLSRPITSKSSYAHYTMQLLRKYHGTDTTFGPCFLPIHVKIKCRGWLHTKKSDVDNHILANAVFKK